MSRPDSAVPAPVRPARGSPPARSRRGASILVALFLGGLVAFALLEALCRLFDPFGVSYYPATAAYLDTMVRGGEIGYQHRPHLDGRYYGVPVKINSLGLREREIPLTPPPGERRVLVLGDSVPFGIAVPWEDAFPYRLEGLLNAGRSGPPIYRVINMGVPSYNTEQQLIQLESLGLRLDPRLVLLFFTENDIEPKMWVFDKRGRWFVDLVQRSYAASSLFILYRAARMALSPSYRLVATEHFEQADPRWQALEDALRRMNALCRERGIPFVLFTELGPNSNGGRLLTATGAREGFPVFHLPLLSDPRWKDDDRRKYRNSYVDGHPTPPGHQVYAQQIYERLAGLGLLDR